MRRNVAYALSQVMQAAGYDVNYVEKYVYSGFKPAVAAVTCSPGTTERVLPFFLGVLSKEDETLGITVEDIPQSINSLGHDVVMYSKYITNDDSDFFEPEEDPRDDDDNPQDQEGAANAVQREA